MLKRAGAIAIAGAMALSLGSVAYAADPTITVGDINIGEADGNGIVTVTVPYTTANLAEGAQVTLLAELGAKEGVYAESIVYETTAYIDQDAAGSEFTFKINKSRLVGNEKADVWLNVKVGGTGVATAAEGSVLAYDYVEAPKTPITSEEVKGALVAVSGETLSDVYGLDNVAIMALDAKDLIANGKLDLTKETLTVDGNPIVYTTYANENDETVTKIYALVDTTVAEHVVAKVDVAATSFVFGNADGDADGMVDIFDAGEIVNKILANDLSATDIKDVAILASDVLGDGLVDIFDAGEIVNYILAGGDYLFDAYTK